MEFSLEHTPGVPVGYINLVEPDERQDSAKQIIVDISLLSFDPQELIFDVDADGLVIGVEIL